jgi:hypothetical protein
MEGGTSAHTVGGQSGGKSIELEQIGCILPFTQRQTQEADASPERSTANNASASLSIALPLP